MVFLSILYILLFFIISLIMVIEYRKSKRITSFTFFNFSFLLYFVLIPILVLFIINKGEKYDSGFLKFILSRKTSDFYYGYLFSTIFYVSFVLFYKVRLRKKKIDTKKINQASSIFIETLNRKALPIGLVCLVISLLSEVVIIRDLGGITAALSKADILRSFNVDGSTLIPQNHLFLTILMVLSLGATYLFYLSNRIAPSLTKKILVIISFFSGAFYLLFNAGRLGILLFLICFLLDYGFRNLKHPFIFVFVVGIIGIIMLDKLDNLFFYMSFGYIKQSSEGFLIKLINEFAFPYSNVLNVLEINQYFGLRYGIDFITWIINIVPYSILSIFGLNKITTSYEFITLYYFGRDSLGGAPTDLITQGIRQFSFWGIFLSSFLIAQICKLIDDFITSRFFSNFTFFALRISSFGFVILPYADLDSFVKNRMDIIILVITLYIAKKSSEKKGENEILIDM